MDIRYQKVLRLFSRIGSLGALVALSMALSAPAWAEPKQISILLSSQGTQEFETLIEQAESVDLLMPVSLRSCPKITLPF
jgi:hypothetical protein